MRRVLNRVTTRWHDRYATQHRCGRRAAIGCAILESIRLDRTSKEEWGTRVLASPTASSSSGLIPWPAALAVWGPGDLSTSHTHHSLQVSVALSGTLRVRTPRQPEWWSCEAAIVPPDVRHEIDARGAIVLIAFLDPESELVGPVLDRYGTDVTPVRNEVVAQWRETLGTAHTLDSRRVDLWMTRLSTGRGARPMHPGVQRVLQSLREDHLESQRTSLTALALVAGLSPSRLMHVFTETVGIPLRPYLLWLRVQRAACALLSGRTVTEAAHLAGFSDAPHLARSLRRTLGTTPRQLLQKVPAPDDLQVASPSAQSVRHSG